MTDRQRADRRSWVQFGLALIGAGAVFGSAAGAALGWMSTLKCWCCTEEGQEA